MKKFYLISTLLFFIVSVVSAQPVITYNNHAPQIGDEFTQDSNTGNYDPGSSGPNQSWDFSGITGTSIVSSIAVDPSGTPFANEFTESNICFSIIDEQVWNYASVSTSEYASNGIGVIQVTALAPSEFVIHYTDPEIYMHYSFAYGNSFSDSYYAAYSISAGIETRLYGSSTVEADAWGSIVTPVGTYSSSLRIQRSRIETDSTFVEGMFISTSTMEYSDYEWYVDSEKAPVFTMHVSDFDVTASWLTESVGLNEAETSIIDFRLYPNPASHIINIELGNEMDENIEIMIYNQLGQQVQQINTGFGNQISLNIAHLQPGIYFVRVVDRQENVVTKKLIKR